MKKLASPFLSNCVGSLIGVVVGVLVTLYFKLPDHKVDVFAFVESALGIVLTALALIVTLGVIKQRAEMETMLATKRDEIVEEAKIKLERDVFQPFKNDLEYKFMLEKQEVAAMKHSYEINSRHFIELDSRINSLTSDI
jgi:uncharacterized membrane protein YgaE (UPF0421/DUF939 family)